jgi:hypothetical protein
VVVVLHQRTLETSLPDVADRTAVAMIAPGVSHGDRLEDAANGHAGLGRKKQMEMVRHAAITVQAERIASLRLGQGGQEGAEVVGGEEDAGAVVAAVEGVVQQAVGDGT